MSNRRAGGVNNPKLPEQFTLKTMVSDCESVGLPQTFSSDWSLSLAWGCASAREGGDALESYGGGRSHLGYGSTPEICLQELTKYASIPFQILCYGVRTMSGSGWSGQWKNMAFRTSTSYCSRILMGRSCARWPKTTFRGSPRATTLTSFCRISTTSERVRQSPLPQRALSRGPC